MSQPRKDGENAIQGASCEIISAMSSMNMHPDPIQPSAEEPGYISQRDGNVKHAMEHLHAAFEYLIQAGKEKESASSGDLPDEPQVARTRSPEGRGK